MLECCVVDRAKGGGMHRHTSSTQIVITDRKHAHDSENAAHHGKFSSRSEADCAVTLFGNALERVGFRQALVQMSVIRQNLGVNVGDELHQCAIGRHFLLIHGRHRC